TEADVRRMAHPHADAHLTKKLLDFVQLSCDCKQHRKGANEATNTLHRGISEFIVTVADAEPLKMILHLPLLRWVGMCPTSTCCALHAGAGAGLGVSRPVIACSVTIREGSQLKQQIQSIEQSTESSLV
ncbi:NH2L1 protein, partial [Crocuta crocuta]